MAQFDVTLAESVSRSLQQASISAILQQLWCAMDAALTTLRSCRNPEMCSMKTSDSSGETRCSRMLWTAWVTGAGTYSYKYKYLHVVFLWNRFYGDESFSRRLSNVNPDIVYIFVFKRSSCWKIILKMLYSFSIRCFWRVVAVGLLTSSVAYLLQNSFIQWEKKSQSQPAWPQACCDQ